MYTWSDSQKNKKTSGCSSYLFHHHSLFLEKTTKIYRVFFSSKIYYLAKYQFFQIKKIQPKKILGFVVLFAPRIHQSTGGQFCCQGSIPNSSAAMESHHTTSKTCRNTARLVKEAQTSETER